MSSPKCVTNRFVISRVLEDGVAPAMPRNVAAAGNNVSGALVPEEKLWYNDRRAVIILGFLSLTYGDSVLYHSRYAFMV